MSVTIAFATQLEQVGLPLSVVIQKELENWTLFSLSLFSGFKKIYKLTFLFYFLKMK